MRRDGRSPTTAPGRRRPARAAILAAVLPVGLCLAGCASDPRPPSPSAPLDLDQATHAAAKFLEGTDYAEDYVNALGRLEDGTLVTAGRNDCGAIRAPTWTFHVRRPHDGMVYVDAATGRITCSSLPFLRL